MTGKCKICGAELKVLETKFVPILGKEIEVLEECENCKRIKAEEEKQKEKERQQAEKQKMFDSLISSNIGRKYYNLTFDKLEQVSPSFTDAMNRIKKYCEVSKTCKDRGLGIYLFGDNGRGKTALIACMFKELIKQGYKPYTTTLNELQDNLINSRITLEEIKNKDFLCLEDIGTESSTKGLDPNWISQILFDITNHRDKELLPTLFTSNIPVSGLERKGIMKKTIERIAILGTVKLEIVSNESYRLKELKNIPF